MGGGGRARGRREYVGTKCVYSYVWRPEVRRLPQFLSILNFETRSLTRTWNMQARLVGIESSRFPQCWITGTCCVLLYGFYRL